MRKSIEIYTDLGSFRYVVDLTEDQILEVEEEIYKLNLEIQEEFKDLEYDPFIYISAIEIETTPLNTVEKLMQFIKLDYTNKE